MRWTTSRRRRWGLGVLATLAAVGAALLLIERAQRAAEIDRLAEALGVEAGSTVADVGAGKGPFAFALAERVGATGGVYATEIDPKRLDQLRDAKRRRDIENVTVVEAGERQTGLEESCCDAAYLRDVYHHLSDPAAIVEDLSRAIRPGGRLVVVDFEPGWFLSRFFPVEDVPENRGGHGVTPEIVIQEVTAAGFTLERTIDEWGPRTFAVVFRRPPQGGAP